MKIWETLVKLRKVNQDLKLEFTLSERFRAGVDIVLYTLAQAVHNETTEEIIRCAAEALGELNEEIPVTVIEEMNKAAFEAESAYRQRKVGVA